VVKGKEASPRGNEERQKTIVPKSTSIPKYKFGAGTTPTTNKNSRKGSEEKNIFKAILSKEKVNLKNSVKLNSTNKSITTNTSIQFNTKATIKKQINTISSITSNAVINSPVPTDSSLKQFSNLLNTNNLKLVNVTSKDSLLNKSNLLLKNKNSIPISVCITNQVSKKTSKNNSKSSSRIDDKTEQTRKKIIENENKKIMSKKHTTSTNSPNNQGLMFNKGSTGKSLSIKKPSSENSTKYIAKPVRKESLENLFDLSTTSVTSTIREANYYKREAEKVADFIRKYYSKHSKYPESNIKMYKVGRVSLYLTLAIR
jgi:hypothetical protein